MVLVTIMLERLAWINFFAKVTVEIGDELDED